MYFLQVSDAAELQASNNQQSVNDSGLGDSVSQPMEAQALPLPISPPPPRPVSPIVQLPDFDEQMDELLESDYLFNLWKLPNN